MKEKIRTELKSSRLWRGGRREKAFIFSFSCSIIDPEKRKIISLIIEFLSNGEEIKEVNDTLLVTEVGVN